MMTKNHPNYDAEIEDAALLVQLRPDMASEVSQYIWERTQVYQSRDMSKLPPALIRGAGESTTAWMTRMNVAGGIA
ncbi:MAG: hypothetical protein ACYTGH_15540 [Planctomycetota bacterium]